MSEKRYFQCRLAQGNERTVGWIEERGARVGCFVEIEELGGFWEVKGVGDKPLLQSQIRAAETNRRNSFASLKKD